MVQKSHYRLMAIIALLSVLCSPALATDITVGAVTLPNFNASGLRAPQTTLVEANGNISRYIVWQAGPKFPQEWIDKNYSGFKILLAGVYYEVEAVLSTDVIKLTVQTPNLGAGVNATIYPFIEMRVYALQAYTPLGAGYVVQAGSPGGKDFFYRKACSVIQGQLYLPQMTLPATRDAVNPVERQAMLAAWFYRTDGSQIKAYDCFGQFQLPETPTTTSWAAICTANSANALIAPDNRYYTATQVNGLLTGYYPNNTATTNYLTKHSSDGTLRASNLSDSGTAITSSVPIVLPANPTSNLQAATKQYVDTQAGGQVFDIRSYGAYCNGIASDQSAIDAAYAAAAAVHGVLYIPPSTAASPCMGHITVSTYGVTVRGAGAQASYLKNTDTTKATIELDASLVNLHEVRIEGLALVGAGSGAANHGIYAHGAAQVNNLVVRDLNISNHGGRGVYDTASFTSTYENMLVAQPASADNAFEVLGANDTTFRQTYVTTVGTNKAAYRVYSGSVSFIGANGINSGTNADWAVLGRTVADDGVDSYVQATFISTNIENFTNRGIRFKTGSFGNFFSTRLTAPASGTVTPLSYQFVDNNSRGIFDAASAINTQGASYTNGAAVNASGAPFLQVGNGDLTQYYDTSIGALIGLPNLTVGLIAGSTNTALLLSRAKVTALEDSGMVGTLTGGNDYAGNASRLLLQNGSASRPVIGFTSDNTTGFYFDGLNQPAVAVTGTKRLTIGAASQFTGAVGINVTPGANYSLDVASGALRVVNATGSSTATGDFQGDNNPLIQIKSTAAGTTTGIIQAGNNTNLIIGTTSNHTVEWRANNTARWYLQASTGDLIPAVAGAVNLGQTGTRVGGVNAQTGNFSTSLTIGGGAAITSWLTNTGTVGNGGANIAAQSCITDTITVTGAASGDLVIGTPPSTIEANLTWNAFVSAANTVRVQVCNPTAGNIASADLTWRVSVIKH